MLDEKILQKVIDFVKKYNERKYIVDLEPFGLKLAQAVHSFEMSDKETDSYFYTNVRELNRQIDYVIASKYLHDNSTILKLEEMTEKYNQLEQELKEAKSKIESLIEEKGVLKGKLEVFEHDLPKSDTFTGDVDG